MNFRVYPAHLQTIRRYAGDTKELLCVGKALLNRVPNVDHAVILARPVLDLGLRILWAEQFAGLVLSRVCVG